MNRNNYNKSRGIRRILEEAGHIVKAHEESNTGEVFICRVCGKELAVFNFDGDKIWTNGTKGGIIPMNGSCSDEIIREIIE